MTTSLMRSVSSSNISAIGYDDSTRALIITFKGSGTYVYDDVPPEIDAGLRAIEIEGGSIGKFFSSHIRNRFASTKTDTLPEFAAAAA